MEVDSDFLYEALVEIDLFSCIKKEKNKDGNYCERKTVTIPPVQTLAVTPYPVHVSQKIPQKRVWTVQRGVSVFRFTEMLCLCSKTHCCYNSRSNM